MSELNGLLQRLSDAGIDFVVVGGVAAVLHGSSMVARDCFEAGLNVEDPELS